MKNRLLCLVQIALLMISMVACTPSIQSTTESKTTLSETSGNVTISHTNDPSMTNTHHLLPDLDQENKRILAELKNEGCLYDFNKKVYPAEKVLDVKKMDFPLKLQDHYWDIIKMYNADSFIVVLLERNPYGSTIGTVWKEVGIYNYVTQEYKKIIDVDNTHQFYVRSIYLVDNIAGEFLLLDSVTETDNNSVKFQYVNLKGETRTVYELAESEYHFMLVPKIIGRNLYVNKIVNDENIMISVNIDTGESKEIDSSVVIPSIYKDSLVYLKADPKQPTLELVGTDFPLSWTRSDVSELPSNSHGSIITHPESDDIFVITKILETERLSNQVPKQEDEENPLDYPLYIVKKYSKSCPDGEEIISIRGGEYGSVYIGGLEFNGRFLTWTSVGEGTHLIYDNHLDVLLYFSDMDKKEILDSHVFYISSPTEDTFYALVLRKNESHETGRIEWDTSAKTPPYYYRFLIKNPTNLRE